MSEWIGVDDRLPAPEVSVLCWLDDGVAIGSLDRTQTLADDGSVSSPKFRFPILDYDAATPSHWMPLPEPPPTEHTK